MKKPSILDVQQLSASRGNVLALWDVSFTVQVGQMLAVVGPNGGGKSTLLEAILGMVKPFSGRALLFDKHAYLQKKRIAYVPQKQKIDWSFPVTVLDVALMGRYHALGVLKWYRKRDKEMALATLKELGLGEVSHRQISALSGGQQQRLFLARALLQEGDLLFLDEPFSGVDKATEKLLVSLLHRLKREGKTIVVVHHDLNTVASYFDSVLILKTSLLAYGDVAKAFTPEHLKRAFDCSNTLLQEVRALAKREKAGLR